MYKDIVKETIDMIFTNIEKCNKSEKHNNVYVYEIAKINVVYINNDEPKVLEPLYINYYIDGYEFKYFITSEKLRASKEGTQNAFIYLYNHKYLVFIDRYLRKDKIIYQLKGYDDIFNIVKDVPINLLNEFLLHVSVMNKLL